MDKRHASQRGKCCAVDLGFYKKLVFPMSLQEYCRDQPLAHVKGVLTLYHGARESRFHFSGELCSTSPEKPNLFRHALSFSRSVRREIKCKIDMDFCLSRFAASGL